MTTTMDLLSDHCFLELPASSCGEKRNDFSKLKKVYKLFSMLFTLLTFTWLKDLLKVSNPLPYIYILEMIFKNSTDYKNEIH